MWKCFASFARCEALSAQVRQYCQHSIQESMPKALRALWRPSLHATQHADLLQFTDQRMQPTASQLCPAFHCTSATFTSPGFRHKVSESPDMQRSCFQ
jgi:hypothetical protein